MAFMRIAISGPTGCGNSTASTIVSQSLGFPKFNYTFHNLANDLGIPFNALHSLADETPKYDFMLDEKQVQFVLENKNCVVGTRLAVFLPQVAAKLEKPKPKFDLKVWLYAPLAVRAQRIADRDGRSFEEALKEVVYRDDSNKTRYKKLYGIEYAEPEGCLVIDTDAFEVEETAKKILDAIKNKKQRKA
ncbi:TPA: AAA family ATPase [Candidatus Micrarchaeota archaeon]|nr:AAA family ATPase [Candidatus Micrarchaeota archaeon]